MIEPVHATAASRPATLPACSKEQESKGRFIRSSQEFGLHQFFMKFAQGDEGVARAMVDQTLQLATLLIRARLRQLIQAMRKNNRDV